MSFWTRELHARAAAGSGLPSRGADAAGTPSTGPLVGSRPHILAVKLADLGDALTATPALRALRNTWPEAQIDVLTSAAGAAALAGLDSVDEIFIADKHRFDQLRGVLSPGALKAVVPMIADLRRRRYDSCLLLHHLTTGFGALKYAALTKAIAARQTAGLDNGRGWFLDLHVPDNGFGWQHEADYAAQVAIAIGASEPPRKLEIVVGAASQQRARELLGEGAGWLAVHAGGGAFSPARRWSPLAFAEASNSLARELHAPLVLLGTNVDRASTDQLVSHLTVESLDLIDKTSVKETAAVLRRCRLLLSNDSGLIHIASAVDTPVTAVFGPSNDRAWGPFPPEQHRVVRVTLPCSPCFYREKSLGTPQGCPTRDCLKLVTPDMVIVAARELLELGAPVGEAPGAAV